MLGGQTVTIRNFTSSGRDRLNQPVKTSVNVLVSGCSMQPTSTSETVTLTDVQTEMWRLYAPPVTAAKTANTASEIIYDSMTFQVLGTRPQVGFDGTLDHVVFDLKKQIA